MGSIVKVHCTSCHKEWNCQTGCGLKHAMLQDAVREFPVEMEREIMKKAGAEVFPAFIFARQIAVCEECGGVVSVPVLELLGSGQVYTGSCPVCGGMVKPVTAVEDTPCPACGERTLREEAVGNWD